MSLRSSGSIQLVGIGYLAGAHVTAETLALIRGADRLFFLVGDPLLEMWLRSLNPAARSLEDCAAEGMPLADCCHRMADEVMNAVRNGVNICVAFSGHPGIAVDPAYEILQRAKASGVRVMMFPAVSTMDCLFADVGIDPAQGCQLFEAETLVEMDYRLDPRSSLILLQAGVIGVQQVSTTASGAVGIRRLTRFLRKYYPSSHEVIVYEAATVPISSPRVERTKLSQLSKIALTAVSTLYVPPLPD
jgi:uncharacterized protein YabN with tetrapyrrole methylase and pyrophosphatase domain